MHKTADKVLTQEEGQPPAPHWGHHECPLNASVTAELRQRVKTGRVRNQSGFKTFIVFQILASITKPQKTGRSEIFSLEQKHDFTENDEALQTSGCK